MTDQAAGRERAADLLMLAVLAAGVAARWAFVVWLHDPRGHVYSDMGFYLGLGRKLTAFGFTPTAYDVTHPPGMPLLIAHFLRIDPTLGALVWFQLWISAAVPLAVGALALVAFGWPTARLAVIVSSLYFPFVDYAGYFLAELYLMLLVPLVLALLLWAATPGRGAVPAAAASALAGVLLTLAMAMKLVALPAVGVFALVVGLGRRARPLRLRVLVLAALVVGALPGTALLASRCTAANAGRFCLVSNKGPSDFLLGHYGRIQSMTWRDPSGPTMGFGSPSAYQRYRQPVEMPFGMVDADANLRAAWGWIRTHPVEALVLSVEHVYDLFVGAMPWPGYAADYWPLVHAFHFLFVVALLLPTLILCVDVVRARGPGGFLGSREWLLLSPVLGVAAAAFVATGEPRYRVPFDGLFVILAVEFYRRLGGAHDGVA